MHTFEVLCNDYTATIDLTSGVENDRSRAALATKSSCADAHASSVPALTAPPIPVVSESLLFNLSPKKLCR